MDLGLASCVSGRAARVREKESKGVTTEGEGRGWKGWRKEEKGRGGGRRRCREKAGGGRCSEKVRALLVHGLLFDSTLAFYYMYFINSKFALILFTYYLFYVPLPFPFISSRI